jgi:iron complex transport system substrate-binding protein
MKNKIQFLWVASTLLLVICCSACGSVIQPLPKEVVPLVPIQSPQEKTPSQTKTEQEEITTFPVTVTDDLGRKITINKLPQRIISLAPSNTEILFALGLDSRIVGVTDYCDYPEAAKSKPRVASYDTPNIEKLVSLQPDLIVAESIHEKTVLPALEKLGLTVYVTWAKSVDTVLQDVTRIGQINGKSTAAAKLVATLTNRIKTVSAKTESLPTDKRPRVLYVMWHQPIWTMGSDTYIDDLFRLAGGNNIFSKDFQKSRIASLESIVAKNPQVIIVTGMATSGDLVYNAVKGEERLRTIDAMVSNRVYKISDSNLIERPGPRIVEGLDELAKLIHPEIFGAFSK